MKRSNNISKSIDWVDEIMRLRAYMTKFYVGSLIAFLVTGSLAAEESTSKQILILASYNLGMKWDDSIISEIEHQFAIYMPSAVIDVVHGHKTDDPNANRVGSLKTMSG